MASTSKESEYGPRPGILVPLPQLERGVAGVTSSSPDGKFFIYSNGTSVIVRSLEVFTFYLNDFLNIVVFLFSLVNYVSSFLLSITSEFAPNRRILTLPWYIVSIRSK